MLPDKEIEHDVFLGLGSNMGDRSENLARAINRIGERIGKVIIISAFYVTEPFGFESENRFLNAVCAIKTGIRPMELLRRTQEIEQEMGRMVKSENKVYADRIIDIDLLLFDDRVYAGERLVLPHPHLHERAFVLLPLAEIAGEYVHPVLCKTINQLKAELG
ncbi:MAG: 2-amino-4-hydroxy-6-hydroxymethyldihydropteridine diphosphokinase [Prevotella sp.]|jgi:2-amino-4-hydroxy-6-hydroxymethyldihydropteridine diphosphokinase|nr:2-amino-4-hydroxy-6-hydroxymethyldihydropteridine diphosphokinase [Prevotella sp.]